jgi:hypothetical protein
MFVKNIYVQLRVFPLFCMEYFHDIAMRKIMVCEVCVVEYEALVSL